jgi:uncharacterized protein
MEGAKRTHFKMRTTMIDSQVLTQIYTDVHQRFAGFDDLAHGWEHIHRVYTLALHIAEREGADRFIVGVAALLHDVGRTAFTGKQEELISPPDAKRSRDSGVDGLDEKLSKHHADLSVAIAAELLQAYNISAQTQEAILHAIVAHSYSRGIQPATLEAHVVRDADRLDGMGAIGIMRWAITATMIRGPQTANYHPDDLFAESRQLDDKRYMLDHFYTKLLKLNNSLLTETGRKIGKRRLAFMYTYLAEFRRELEMT